MTSMPGGTFLLGMVQTASPVAESAWPDWVTWWMAGALAISVIALLISLRNLCRFRRAPAAIDPDDQGWSITVCIPARNEAANLEACVRSALDSADADPASSTTIMVYDDASDDQTPAILAKLAEADRRVIGAGVNPLPSGWNGKQHACDRMGRQAETDWLLFTDADVRFAPDCLKRTRAAVQAQRGVNGDIGLLSAFPRERTGTVGETLVVPLIHFILMSYLPIGRMRSSLDPAASAACGQFVLARRDAWLDVGGHAVIRNSMHDGVRLPRIFRRAGHATDIFDGTDIVHCRMYHGFAETWRGFAKNAYEGLGNIFLLLLLTMLHLGGHVAPWFVLGLALVLESVGPETSGVSAAAVGLASAAVIIQITQRMCLAVRFQQAWTGVVLHPAALMVFTLLQWWSLLLHITGRRSWRGRLS
jgi:glycosyltransferase involved in cell wall biosynthesis